MSRSITSRTFIPMIWNFAFPIDAKFHIIGMNNLDVIDPLSFLVFYAHYRAATADKAAKS